MSSYLPPSENLDVFNADNFNSSLSRDKVEAKINALEAKTVLFSDSRFAVASPSTNQEIVTGEYSAGALNDTISFGITFDSEPNVFVNPVSTSDTQAFIVNVKDISTTSFFFRTYYGDTTDDTLSFKKDVAVPFRWVAIGTRS